jgi:hypothetical protein
MLRKTRHSGWAWRTFKSGQIERFEDHKWILNPTKLTI